jgi:hypothetical protein
MDILKEELDDTDELLDKINSPAIDDEGSKWMNDNKSIDKIQYQELDQMTIGHGWSNWKK